MIYLQRARPRQEAGFLKEVQSRSLAKDDQEAGEVSSETKPTFIDLVELADDVQTYFRELVLEEVEEKWQKVLDGVLLSEQRREATDLGGESCPDVLRCILAQVSDTRNDPEQDHLFLEQFREPWVPVNVSVTTDRGLRTGDLTRGSGANLSLVVLQKLDVMSNQLLADKILSNGLCQLMTES